MAGCMGKGIYICCSSAKPRCSTWIVNLSMGHRRFITEGFSVHGRKILVRSKINNIKREYTDAKLD